MDFSLTNTGRARRRLLLISAACIMLAALPLLVHTHAQPVGLRVVNNSALEIRHLYLSPSDREEWGADQLDHATIGPGETFTINNVSCGQAEIKLIAEDQNGCFVSQVVACADN